MMSSFLDALGADPHPRPPPRLVTFCRRFTTDDVDILQDIFDPIRRKLWKQQPSPLSSTRPSSTSTGTPGGHRRVLQAGASNIAYDGTWGAPELLANASPLQEGGSRGA